MSEFNLENKSDNSLSLDDKRKCLLKKRPVFSIIILLFILVAGFFLWRFYNNPKQDTETNTDISSGDTSALSEEFWDFNLTSVAFANNSLEFEKITPSLRGEKVLASSLKNLADLENDEGVVLTGAQIEALESNGFFLTENDIITDQSSWQASDDFIDSYKVLDGDSNPYNRDGSDAIFISSDLALHLYHILVDRSFQKIEEDKMQPQLREITRALFLDSINNYNNLGEGNLKEAYKILSVYYLIPLVILDAGSEVGVELNPSDFPTFAKYLEAQDAKMLADVSGSLAFSLEEPEYEGIVLDDKIYNLAKEELELIKKSEGIISSPLFTPYRPEFLNDYSQFVPRSHYTKNDVLKSYFIAMMWYGRMGFNLTSSEMTRSALIITGQINNLSLENGDKIARNWSDMMAVIDFFVGEVDDLTALDYTPLISKVYGQNVTVSDFSDDAKLEAFVLEAKSELKNPKIVSEALEVFDDGGKRDELLANTKQFRFMGQRFTPDAYIINNLTQGIGAPDPETGQMLPTMPTALMPLAVISEDNETVTNYLNEWINDKERIESQGRESDKIIAKVLTKLRAEFEKYTPSLWQSNIYFSWLDTFRSLLRGYSDGYPYFMKSNAWAKKNLGTVLGSFTELKHDTLLYAKQSYAELGAGPGEEKEMPEVVKGYVEPDLEFWQKIITLAKLTESGLKERGYFPEGFDYKYQAFITSAEFFYDISKRELLDETISDEDFEKLRVITNTLGIVVSPLGGEELSQKDKRSGIIADIHTDAVNQEILYEATSKPYLIYVAVSDVNGTRLTRGAVFSQYEFTEGINGRLSDEAWQERVYEGRGELPNASKWSLELIR